MILLGLPNEEIVYTDIFGLMLTAVIGGAAIVMWENRFADDVNIDVGVTNSIVVNGVSRKHWSHIFFQHPGALKVTYNVGSYLEAQAVAYKLADEINNKTEKSYEQRTKHTTAV